MEIMNASAEQVAAMKQRLRTRQEERRAMEDIDAFVRVVNSRNRSEVVGVIVPLEEAREYEEFQRARKMRGNWKETAMMVVVSLVMFAVSIVRLFA